MDLSVRIGSLILRNPLIAASGCFGYGVEYAVVPLPANPEAEMQAVSKGVELGLIDQKLCEMIGECAKQFTNSGRRRPVDWHRGCRAGRSCHRRIEP